MFLAFSPFTFLFFLVYIILFLFMFTSSNFFFLWIFMEMAMLIYMGISFTLFSGGLSFLMMYFLIQTFSSFSFLVFYLFSFEVVLTLSFLLKLSMFPFHFWFPSVLYRFPNFLLFLSSTIHKVPIFLLITYFSIFLNFSFVCVSVIVSTLISGFLMLSSSDLRLVIISSSVGNNSWFYLSAFQGLDFFFVFLFFYSFNLFILLFQFGFFSKVVGWSYSKFFMTPWIVISLSGLPPFPLFFCKMFVLVGLFMSSFSPLQILFFLFATSFMIMGYFLSVFKFFFQSSFSFSPLLY